MARIYPGAKVPNRKPRPNPTTITGFPRINTYAGLDCTPCSWDGADYVVTKGLPGGKRRCNRKRGLDKRNVAHRCKPTDIDHGWNKRHFEAARALIVECSRTKDWRVSQVLKERYTVHVDELRARGANNQLVELRRLAKARGCFVGI